MAHPGVYVVGMVLFGCLNTETTKMQFTLNSRGIDGTEKPFHKPWQAVFTMFMAMTVVLFYHVAFTARARSKNVMIDQGGALLSNGQESQVRGIKKFMIVGAPALFDLLGTGFGMIGFVYLSASINQMLRGSTIVFSAIFSVLFLGKKMMTYNWIGIGLCMVGICLVAASNILGQDSGKGRSANDIIFGISSNLLGQVFAASQIITEEKLLKSLKVPPMQVVGYEGVWGCFIMLFIMFPLLYMLPGSDEGSVENAYDTYLMLSNNHQLLALICLYIFSCSTYNIAGMLVTSSLSAVHRTMMDASRTMFIWIINLSIHYFVDASSGLGEAWTSWSFLQLAGFLVVICGQTVYGSLLRIPGLTYDDAKVPLPTKSPAGFYTSAAVSLPGGLDEDLEDEATPGRSQVRQL